MPLDDQTMQSLARYLDGSLTGEELERFERQLVADAGLRAEAERQRRIEGALRRIFVAPPFTAERVLATANLPAPSAAPETAIHQPAPSHTSPNPIGRLQPLVRASAVAAVIVGGIFGVWMVWQEFKPDPTARLMQGPPPLKTAADYYNIELARGFEPDWVCADDAEFAETFRKRFGEALMLRALPPGSRMLGLDYAPVLSPLTIGLLAKVNEHSVLVLIDRRSADDPDHIYTDCANLRVHRREIGALVLYEITPLPQAHVLDALQSPSEGGA